MKSKIKVIVIGLIILCLAGVYAIIDKAVSIYDTSCDTSAFQSITLEQGKKLEQSFVCKENHMDGISLKVAADGVLDKSRVVMAYKIIEKDSKEVVAQGKKDLKKVRNGKFFKIKFDRIDATKDKKYMLEMSVQECPTGSIRVFYTPGSNENATLIYDGQTIEGVGVIRSLTHRFDLETFIVTLCFAAYIILFMRWLYKLFE